MSDTPTAGTPETEQKVPPFSKWLRQVPVTYGLVSAAAAAVLGLFAPTMLIPEPLASYRSLATLMVVVAFVLTWAWQRQLRTRFRTVITTTAVLFTVLVILRVLFVRDVYYSEEPAETRYFVVGPVVVDSELAGLSDEDIIKMNGGSWSDLRAVWGGGFVAVAVAYALTYLLFVQGLVVSIGASDLAKQPTSRRRKKRGLSP